MGPHVSRSQAYTHLKKKKRVEVKELSQMHNSRNLLKMRFLYTRLLKELPVEKVAYVDELCFKKVVKVDVKYSKADLRYGAVAEVNMMLA